MSADKETKRRMDKVKSILDDIYDTSESLILVGSLSFSHNHDVKPTSDVDLIVITNENHLKETALSCGVFTSENDFDANIVRFQYDNDEFDIALHTMTKDTFSDICGVDRKTLIEMRTKPKDGCFIPAFDGSELFWDLKRKNYGLWNKILVPVFVRNGEKIHIGPHQNMLLSKPTLLYDREDFGKIKIDLLWDAICTEYKKELKINPNISFYNIFKRYDRFSEEAKNYVDEKLISRLKTYEKKPEQEKIKRRSDI